MVNFYVASIEIENFRGVRSLHLDFDRESPAILIGPNNSGKSTILDAIGLCLSSPKFSKYLVDSQDFWRHAGGDIADEFVIEVCFGVGDNGTLPAVKGGIGDPIPVAGVRARCQREGATVSRILLDSEGDEILVNKSTPVSKAKRDDYRGMGLTGRRYARPYDIQQWLPEVWHLDSQNLFVSLYQWKTGPLQRLMAMYREKLFSEEWETPSGRKMPEVLTRAHEFIRGEALKTPFWTEVLSKRLKEKFGGYLGKRTRFDLFPDLSPIEAWILSQLQVKVAPGPDLAAVDSQRLGDGWQSLIRLAALELAIELTDSTRKVLLLIEEPETYLHPHLRRSLRRVFDKFQSTGHQSFVTTHSGELISFNENQQIIRLSMSATGVDCRHYATSAAGQALKDQEKLYERGNHEVVFANAAILTEGKPDQYAVRLGLEKVGRDCDVESISVLDCGGVGNLPDYARLCGQLGVPWIAIHDQDFEASGGRKARTQQAHKVLEELAGPTDMILEWENNLDEAIGFRRANLQGKVSAKWIQEKYAVESWGEIRRNPDLAQYAQKIQAAHDHLNRINEKPKAEEPSLPTDKL